MIQLAEAPAEGTDKPAPHPAWLRQVREGALLCIVEGFDPAYLAADVREHVAAEMRALRAGGTSRERAAKLLAHLKDGREFRAIPGGGETTETLRAVLRLVGAR